MRGGECGGGAGGERKWADWSVGCATGRGNVGEAHVGSAPLGSNMRACQ